MIGTHLPALQVVLPLLCAPLCVLLRNRAVAYGIAVVACLGAFAISWLLLQQVLASGPISYEMGGWAPPWGIEYYVDTLNAYVLLIVAGIGAVVILGAWPSVCREVNEDRQYLYYTTYLLCFAGLLGVTITGDAFNIFVFMEISSLSSYVLIGMSRDPRGLTAAFRYLTIGTIGATFFLIGVGLIYAQTGSLNIHDMGVRLEGQYGSPTVQAAVAFILVGLSVKAAIFPLHVWLPNAYAYAPSISTAFLASTATKVSIYVLVRMTFNLLDVEFTYGTALVDYLLMAMALLGMFAGTLVAMFQQNVKRMLAYSSVAQIGYMVLGISLVTVTGVAGGLLHVFNHAIMKGTLFMALACIFWQTGSARLVDMRGIARRMPWTMGAFVVGGMGLIGVPLTAGFISKWYLLRAALESKMPWLAVLIVVASLLSIIYVWRVVEAAYFKPLPEGTPEGMAEAPLPLLVPTWLLALATIYFGIDTSVSADVAERAASLLLGGAP